MACRSRDLHAAVRSLLAEAPVFTATGVLPLLGQLIAAGGEWATAGLGAAREALLERPALRQPLLQLVLAAASGGCAGGVYQRVFGELGMCCKGMGVCGVAFEEHWGSLIARLFLAVCISKLC